MPSPPKYCCQCAVPLEMRFIDDHQRQVCPACGYIHYRNPLPVAAAVVLNEQERVLLIKRRGHPCKGLWCLPMGFAELEETIQQAAVRELKEEAGIVGRVLRLIDADSLHSNYYGDVLVVTFQLAKVGGVERAGDDAEDFAYFSPDDLPPLAFDANLKAIRLCLGSTCEPASQRS